MLNSLNKIQHGKILAKLQSHFAQAGDQLEIKKAFAIGQVPVQTVADALMDNNNSQSNHARQYQQK